MREEGMGGQEQRDRTEEERVSGPEQKDRIEEERMSGPEQRDRIEEERMSGLEQGEEREYGQERRPEKKRLTGSLAVKVMVFFLLVVCFVTGSSMAALGLYCWEAGVYTEKLDDLLIESLHAKCAEAVDNAVSYLSRGDLEGAEEVCRDKNIGIAMFSTDEKDIRMLWNTWNGGATELTLDLHRNLFYTGEPITLNGHTLEQGGSYLFRVYMDEEFLLKDEFQEVAELIGKVYEKRYAIIGLALGSVILFMVCFVFLLSSVGHRNGYRGIAPSVLTGFHLDVLTVVWGGAVYCLLRVMGESVRYGSEIKRLLVLLAGGTVVLILVTFYLMELALRMKMGNCLRHTLIYKLGRAGVRALYILKQMVVAVVSKIPAVACTILAFIAICILELIVLKEVRRLSPLLSLWAVEKVLLFGGVLYIALVCKRFLEAGRALAAGQENYAVDTSRMFGDFREHGENLNSIGVGIARAVEERMKSERLKTELITNVSHDIKTPLTSIINYADLICEETNISDSDQEGLSGEEEHTAQDFQGKLSDSEGRIREYAEVLLRQSRRLKKLLEDLVEASKATTGNLEVDLVPCQAGVILTQAVGEYQSRMEEKGLELIARQPQESVRILADGRHLWRVFDNLLSNTCKYAQEHSRVYLSVEEKGGRVLVVFRNMSKYPLEMSGEELEERFVRGDRSRHMEGNGLGLSIAKSLVELQGGRMEIVTDGDLFKVILSFAAYREA